MIKLSIILTIFLLMACSQSRTDNISTSKEKKTVDCSQLDTFLVIQEDLFEPKDVNLSTSINHSLDSFLLNTDTNCIRKQNKYREFITVILSKLALYHLKCCNQGYDLYQMQGRPAQIIIHEFENISNYKRERLEMLNSGILYDYVSNDSVLKSNERLKRLVYEIKKENDRILTTLKF